MKEEEIWIKIALSDLKGAKILYSQRQFRTSYFLFQQASEKANKAFALKFGLAKSDELKNFGHNQFKILRNYIVGKIRHYDSLSGLEKKDPTKLAVKAEGMKNALSSIDKLRNQDLINISIKDLKELYSEIEGLNLPFLKRNPKAAKEFFEKSKQSKNINKAALLVLQWSLDFYYILMAIFICATLTTQHSSTTRYPEDGKTPFDIYTSKLPLVKMQVKYMSLLEDAIKKMTKHSDEAIIKKMEKMNLPTNPV